MIHERRAAICHKSYKRAAALRLPRESARAGSCGAPPAEAPLPHALPIPACYIEGKNRKG